MEKSLQLFVLSPSIKHSGDTEWDKTTSEEERSDAVWASATFSTNTCKDKSTIQTEALGASFVICVLGTITHHRLEDFPIIHSY